MKLGQIYKITNTINNKVYIGQTIQNVRKRWYDHISQAKNSKKPGHFQRAILKYGKEVFKVETLERDIHRDELDEKEQEYITKFDSYNTGYNSTTGGQKPANSTEHYIPTPEHKANMSKAKKGKALNWSVESLGAVRKAKIGNKNPNYGKKAKRVCCLYCKKEVAINVFVYYHGDYCKSNPDKLER